MKKLFSLAVITLLFAGNVFAQLSTGEPHANVVPRTGNRPQEGDFGMYFGASVTQIMDLVNLNSKIGGNAFWALPAINIKYYFTDNWEGRIGFQFARKGTKNTVKYKEDGLVVKTNDEVNYTRFLPGLAYHFNTNNILDVYLGAQIPVGFDLNHNENYGSFKGNTNKTITIDNDFVIGAGIFLGLQVFVADLPFAIGVETGYSGIGRVATNPITKTDTNGTKAKFLSSDLSSEIKSSAYMEGTWGADAAIMFTYFFKQ